MSSSTQAQPSPDEIRGQLERVLQSKLFVQSERLQRFLLFTVGATLTGQTEQIKEYTLGRDVFDRDQSYDPRVDSIVRVEARRLRRKLDEYYGKMGERDPVRIEFHQGSYVPVFRYAPPSRPTLVPFTPPQPRPLNPRTVAVLPFRSLSGDAGQEYLSEGMGEEILNTLARIPQLNVVARTSAFHFEGRNASMREIGEQLGAGTIIEGSVRTAGDRLRIAAQAVDVASGVVLWSGSFDRGTADVFAVQDEIALAIAQSLQVSLVPPLEAAPRNPQTAQAYSHYLKGRHFWEHVSEAGVDAALNEFNQSIALFPGYAPAHVGLANAFMVLTFWGVVPPPDGLAKAKGSALEALRLDGGLSGAYAMLGVLASCADWEWEKGALLLKKGVELQPSNMIAHTYYALHLICLGRFAEVMQVLERSLQLDPFSPWSFRNQGWYYYFQRDYEPAIEALQTSLTLDPRYREAQFMLGYAYLRARRYDEAIEQFLTLPEGPYSPTRLGALGEAYAVIGDRTKAMATLAELDALAARSYVSPMIRSSILAGLGDRDGLFQELERAYASHSLWMCLLKVDPRFDAVRADPRFQDLLERMRLS